MNCITRAGDPMNKLLNHIRARARHVVVCEPGRFGIDFDRTHVVTAVAEGGQALKLGIQAGWTIKQINDEDFSNEVFNAVVGSGKPYRVTALKGSSLSDSDTKRLLEQVEKQGRIDELIDDMRLIQHAVVNFALHDVQLLMEYSSAINHADARLDALKTAVTSPELEPCDKQEAVRWLLMRGASPDIGVDAHPCMDLVMKYWFGVARMPLVASLRREQRLEDVAKHHLVNLPNLARLPDLFFGLIGQRVAIYRTLLEIVEWAFRLASKSSPLVLVFAGPSGHGKTELAARLCETVTGSANDFKKIDCSQMKTATEIFGLGGAWQGSMQGSELNNFIVSHQGRPAVVLMDEIEKAREDVWESFLNIWDKGSWTDKRLSETSQSVAVDCSRVLWILTTNAFDPAITQYCIDQAVAEKLCQSTKDFDVVSAGVSVAIERVVRPLMAQKFRPPFAGRVDAIVPFLPFINGDDTQPAIQREVAVLIAAILDKELTFLKEPKRNKHGMNLVVSIHPEMRVQLTDIIRRSYLACEVEGVRAISRLVRQHLKPAISQWWMPGRVPRMRGSLEVHCESEVVDLRQPAPRNDSPLRPPAVTGQVAPPHTEDNTSNLPKATRTRRKRETK